MTQYYGDFVENDTVYLVFNTFTSDDPSASCTITNFMNTDVHIHKDGGVVQRNNAAGVTVSVDFDGITGSHMIAIDTSDNTVSGFWVTGSDYFVRIEGTTVDGATINAVVGHFSIENRYMRGTNSASLATSLATAQTDLDTITGTDGVTLATTQALYAPNTVVPDAAGTAPTAAEIRQEMDNNSIDLNTISANVVSTLADTHELQSNQGNWLTATGFSVPNEYDIVIAALQADLDNPDQYKASVIELALEATLTDMKGATFSTGTDSLEAIRDRGDAAWVTGAGGSAPTVEEIRIEMDTNSADLNAILADTNELQTNQSNWATATGFSVPNEYDAVIAALQADLNNPDQYKANIAALALEATLTDMKGATFLTGTDSLEAIRNRGDVAWLTGAGGSAPTVEEIRIEMDTNSADLNAILADTNELQTNQSNWATATGFSTHAAVDVWASVTRSLTDKAGFSLSTAGIRAVWDQLTSALTTVGSVGKLIVDNINATISSRNSITPPTVTEIRTEMDANSTKMAPSQNLADYMATGFATSAELSAVDTKVDAIGTDVDTLVDEVSGKWEIINDQMIFYKADNTTEVFRFNLFDAAGQPSMTDVVKRERV